MNTDKLFYEPTKFNKNEKGIENYQTGKKETINYKNILQPSLLDAELDNKTGSRKISRKGISNASLTPKLDKGEFAVVERKYSEVGMFEFTTRDDNKINSAADVAFIFRQLESEAVEHAFAVYIDKDKQPSVQWLSMGGVNATIVDPRVMIDAADRLKAKEIYLVHNHPSGSLVPSRADIQIIEKLKNGFGPMGIDVNAIIINLNSGNYLQFDENGNTVEVAGFTSADFKREEKVGVFSFNKQAFLQSPLNKKIHTPSEVAEFLSQQKFSSGEKAGYLLLTMKNEIVGNFFATQNTKNKAYKEVAGLVSKFGGVNVIAYTNKADVNFYKELKVDLNNLEINLHDVIECESSAFVRQTFDKYKSLAQEGLLYEMQTNYKTNKSEIMNTQNNLHEENLTNQGTELNNTEETYLQKNLDYINNQIKYLGFGEGFHESLQEAMKSGSDKIDFPISKEFSSTLEKSNPIDFTLHFNKGKESNMYFLNSYSAQLNIPNVTPENTHSQTFYLNKGKGFTAKEAFNLLSDRSVNKDLTNKEGVTYNAWVKLKPTENNGEKRNRDFQIFNENYGYDLWESLYKHPIKEMETPAAEDKLINSLKKGNLQSVTFSENGGDIKKFIEANPQYKNINIYNEDGKKQFIPQGKSETQNATNHQPIIEKVMEEKKSAGIKR
ncbi:MAG: JAB domain-containing protein [Bacteroidota bacterium]|nr:JAB domain-containing protein [Bacteroidota bacterium]